MSSSPCIKFWRGLDLVLPRRRNAGRRKPLKKRSPSFKNRGGRKGKVPSLRNKCCGKEGFWPFGLALEERKGKEEKGGGLYFSLRQTAMLDYWRSFGEAFSTAELRSRRPLRLRGVFDLTVSARPRGPGAAGGREKTKTENTGGPGGPEP